MLATRPPTDIVQQPRRLSTEGVREVTIRMHSIARLLAIAALGSGVCAGCSDEATEPSTRPAPKMASADSPTAGSPPASGDATSNAAAEPTREERIEAGRVAYNANCIACHSTDPTRDGALGPAVAGSSLELLRARVLRAEYPPGYEPKRKTRVMVALPHLERQLPDLAAYLQSLD
jgi:mono/diheme cytochrome c family protein